MPPIIATGVHLLVHVHGYVWLPSFSAHAAVTADPALVRPVAVYQFVASHDAGIPKEVTVSDSAGVLVATFRLPGAAATRPMMVEVLNNDLVLQGETPWGVLTLVLYQNDQEPVSAVVGRWILGDKEGKLRAAR